MNDDNMTPAHAEALMRLAAQLTDVMVAAGRANHDLTWLNMVMAAGVACRGVAAVVMAENPEITLNRARIAMMGEFANVMALPAELVRTVPGGDDGTVVIPVKRH